MTQDEVDEVRMRVTIHWVRGLLKKGVLQLGTVPKHHLWFPADDVNIYELRQGNAPPSSDRPRHLKKLELWLDPDVPGEIREFVRMEGGLDKYIESKLHEAGKELTPNEVAEVRNRAIANFCKTRKNMRHMVAGSIYDNAFRDRPKQIIKVVPA